MHELQIGPFRLQAERLALTCDGKSVAVGRKVVDTLLALAERAGEPASKAQLLDRIWPEGCIEEANLAQNVYVLRKLFRQHGVARSIETVARYGYRLALPVLSVGAATADQATRPAVVAAAPQRRTQFAIRRMPAALAAVACAVVALAVASSTGFGQHDQAAPRLSARGARLYTIADYYWNLRTEADVTKSIGYFSQVIDTDPADPRGYAGLADANAIMGDYCYGTHRPGVYFARARAYAEKALVMDPHSPEAHAVLGFIAIHNNDLDAATSQLQQAIATEPGYGPAQEWYGIAQFERGRDADGLAHLQIASRLDPLSVSTTAWLSYAALRSHRLDDSIALSRQALELSPQRADVLTVMGRAYEAKGRVDLAIDAFKRFGAVDPAYRPESAALLARAYAIAHNVAQARAQFAYALAHAGATDFSDLTSAAAALGESRALSNLRPGHPHIASMA
jgi:DNA-binding winged helix-turn-helix (wHTH) protein/Tfp pilus assembly protein PilF